MQASAKDGTYIASQADGDNDSALQQTLSTLHCFAYAFLGHPSIQQASVQDCQELAHELTTFLEAHFEQLKGNAILARAQQPPYATRTSASADALTSDLASHYGSFKQWVRTTSADHTSCPCAYRFAQGLRARGLQPYLGSARARYISDDVCRHLATMCRIYNDLGSIERDRAEFNLNSVQFGEFAATTSESGAEEQKQELFEIAGYERRAMESSLAALLPLLTPAQTRATQTFFDVTDLWGQVYVVRDISSRLLAQQKTGQ